MRAPTDVPRLRDYLTMLVRVWPVVLVATLLSAGAAVAVTELRKPSYSASIVLFSTVTRDPGTFASLYGGMGAQSPIPTYMSLATSRQVVQRTIDDLQLSTTVDELASRIAADWTPGGADYRGLASSVVLRVSVTEDNPDTAVDVANAVAGNLIELSKELHYSEPKLGDEDRQGPYSELMPIGLAPSAHEVREPIYQSLAIGGGVGLALSVIFMLAVQIYRSRVDSVSQLNHIVKQATQANT